ncbi:3-keto-disaccharide hydrolase [Aporhodopirellula aestuarii]|uniref:DUF1080 domain-containing protein n=1 Tax=Aporhodopirellula aestuarii TaxID=2950107 RepID=A0ABT0TXW3_9BACT|nr:family 16 glycoside hydrolase [Aporhodopirellula aestuarii]MCM2369311.1 DUF1080 domain-containing protein [Aporhodopirellula aestuarii]
MNFPQRNLARCSPARTITPVAILRTATAVLGTFLVTTFCCLTPSTSAAEPASTAQEAAQESENDPAPKTPPDSSDSPSAAPTADATASTDTPAATSPSQVPTDTTNEAAQPKPVTNGQRRPLFDGKSLTGWTNPYEWGKVEVVDGEIHLTSDREFFLVTEQEFYDYEFEGELKLPEGKSNSGFMARGQVLPNRVYGYQAEADPTERRWSGGLYDESRRQWLNPLWKQSEAQAAFDRNRWNRFRIRCVGNHLQFFVNDVPTTDYFDTADLSGRIGLQHHGEKGQTYRFRNLIVRELGKQQWVPLFNAETATGELGEGEIIPGWKTIGGGNWTVADGILQGRASIEANEPNGLLYSTKEFTNATFRIVYRFKQGDSGFFVRSRITQANPFVVGVQCEIDGSDEVAGLYQTGGKGWVAKPLHYLETRFPPDRRDVVRFQWNQARNGVDLSELATKPPTPESAEQAAQAAAQDPPWHTMIVNVHGKRIVTHLNDCLASDFVVDDLADSGVVALQLHGNQNLEIDFRSVEVLQPVTE